MDLRDALLSDRSKEQRNAIVDYIGTSPDRYKALWEIIKTEEPPLPQRAAWVLDESSVRHPHLFDHILDEAVAFLPQEVHDAVPRAITKVLGLRTSIPEEHQGMLFSLAIDWMLSPTKPVALKVHCMTFACTIALPIPELREELAIVIKDQIEFNTVAFSSRGRKILKRLSKAGG